MYGDGMRAPKVLRCQRRTHPVAYKLELRHPSPWVAVRSLLAEILDAGCFKKFNSDFEYVKTCETYEINSETRFPRSAILEQHFEFCSTIVPRSQYSQSKLSVKKLLIFNETTWYIDNFGDWVFASKRPKVRYGSHCSGASGQNWRNVEHIGTSTPDK
ncbi:hypothetical protein NQ317_016618 [Molorchus minor]|uniref:Uncharacterized protein n=1 Tax=Molorchus minor TaxID=1323400 RepID=A0ABQ9ISR0_9CUCU|nr:hypothetical protein NQ317_016618 [Molorchus minor]